MQGDNTAGARLGAGALIPVSNGCCAEQRKCGIFLSRNGASEDEANSRRLYRGFAGAVCRKVGAVNREAEAAFHEGHQRRKPLCGRAPERRMETQSLVNGAGDTPRPQIGFGHCARDGLGLLSERVRLPCPLLGLGFPFRLALGEGFRAGGNLHAFNSLDRLKDLYRCEDIDPA